MSSKRLVGGLAYITIGMVLGDEAERGLVAGLTQLLHLFAEETGHILGYRLEFG